MSSDRAATMTAYDPVQIFLHWISALLIVTTGAIGLQMTRMPAGSEVQAQAILQSYSLHKTLGLAMLAVAIVRILWALTHPRPGPLHPERKAESLLASTTHWSLYGATVVMPLSGWAYHSASPAFAPILGPVPQRLPFMVENPASAAIFGQIHLVSAWVLGALFLLHLAGVARHAVIDSDATLARMTTGNGPAVPRAEHDIRPVAVAILIWAATLALAFSTARLPEADPFAGIGEDEPQQPANDD